MPWSSAKTVVIFLATSSFVRFRLVWTIIFRFETVLFVVVIWGFLLYARWLTRHYRPLMLGEKLQMTIHKKSGENVKPTLIDIGFSKIPRRPGGTWRLKHQIFSYYAATGYRPYMEDRMHYMNDPHHNISIFSIFDGHGGPFVSQYLEDNFSTAIHQRLLRFHHHRGSLTAEMQHERATQAIVTEVLNIDDAICRLPSELTSFTGSTLISVILERNRYLTVVNVGDSRAVACDASGEAVALSADHKPTDEKERRRVERAGGFIQFNGVERVQGILSVTRAFGDTHLKRSCLITAHPDIVRVDLSRITRNFIVVASDGFWDVLSNDEAIRLTNQYLKKCPRSQWHGVTEYLVKTALKLGTDDNLSVLVVRLDL
ncbi:hypothetical protein AB6A40_001369 [Gnathostoma spinigerum]|uniref:PPM-type phosphatase domain-containing protein n=1 Tax=Gnathostoma spinigerum TaxID=75299 RepID=A0ABD6E413_9BILA